MASGSKRTETRTETAPRVESPYIMNGNLENAEMARFHLAGGDWIDVELVNNGAAIRVRGINRIGIFPDVSNTVTIKIVR